MSLFEQSHDAAARQAAKPRSCTRDVKRDFRNPSQGGLLFERSPVITADRRDGWFIMEANRPIKNTPAFPKGTPELMERSTAP